eukprot:5932792-Pyramimonas_sp.AAC.1
MAYSLTSDGDRIAAYRFSRGEAGFATAYFIFKGRDVEMQTEVPNSCVSEDGKSLSLPKVAKPKGKAKAAGMKRPAAAAKAPPLKRPAAADAAADHEDPEEEDAEDEKEEPEDE